MFAKMRLTSMALALMLALAPFCSASVILDDGNGQLVYLEDFSDPAAIDADAGPAPGLDATVVTGATLRQEPGGPRSAELRFTDPNRFAFDPAHIQISSDQARLVGTAGGPPIAYWRLEDAAWNGSPGEVADTSGNGLDGQSFGGASLDAAGFLGQGAAFDGSGYVTAGQAPALDFSPAADDFTFSIWFKTTQDGALMGKAVDSLSIRQAYLFLLGGRLSANVGGVQRSGSLSDLRDDQWHHAALVVSNIAGPSQFRLYVDGVLDGTFTPGANTNSADFMIGARRQNGNVGSAFHFTGLLDEVAVFDSALDGDDIAEIYASGAGRILGQFPDFGPSIRDTEGLLLSGFSQLTGMTEDLAAPFNAVGYRLSADGALWRYFDGAGWVEALAGEFNDIATVDANLASFPALAGERLYIEIVLPSDGTEDAATAGATVQFDAPALTQASEILGPIEVGQAVSLSLVATEDPLHTLRLQVLGNDAVTPIDDTELAGNSAGFAASQVAGGLDLSGLSSQTLYLRLDFFNPTSDDSSATLDEIRLTFTAPSVTDLEVTMSAPAGPVLEGEAFDFILDVSNLGAASAEQVRLDISLPQALDADNFPASAPAPWICLTQEEAEPLYSDLTDIDFVCMADFIDAGAVHQITVPRRLRTPFSGYSPLLATARVRAANDENAANDSAAASVAVDAPALALFSIQKTSEPIDGTDFDFLISDPEGQSAFQLDARDSFDGDQVPDSDEFWVSPGVSSVEELTAPPTWQLDSITCETSAPYDTIVDLPIDSASWQFDPAAIAIGGGSARLQASDSLRTGLIGYWRMEESSWAGGGQPVLDESGSAGHGAVFAAAQPAPGHVTGGGDFSGGFVEISSAAYDFAPGSDDFSAGVWFQTQTDGALFGKAVGSLTQRQYYLFIFQGRLWANIGGVQHAGGPQVADGNWHHALVVNHGDGQGAMAHTLYLDGQAVGTWSSGSATNGASLLLGARRENGNIGSAFALDGQLDEATIWNRALDAAEVADLYAAGSGRIIGNDFPSDRPSLTLLAAADSDVLAWQGLAASTGSSSAGRLLYQVASSEGDWRYWDGSSFQSAISDQDANDAATLNAHLGDLPITAPGEIWLRVFFDSDGTEPVVLDGLRVAFRTDHEPATVIDGPRVEADLRLGQPISCVFHNVVPVVDDALTFRIEAPPSDGTDIFFDAPGLGSFWLDDAQPDDGDAVAASVTFDNPPPGQFAVTPFPPAGWRFDGADCAVDSEGIPFTFISDYPDAAGHSFDHTAIEVASGARLRDGAEGLTGYWTFNGFEDWSDSSGNGNDGQVGGASSAVTTLGDDDASFDGSGYLSLGQAQEIAFDPADEFTISLWFRSDGDGALIAKAVSSVSERQFYLFTWQGRLWANVGGAQNGSATGGLYDGAWHHAALVNFDDSGTMRHALYLNGQLEGTWPSGTATNSADVLLGARRLNGNTSSGFHFTGEMDEVRLYDRGFSDTEIGDLYGLGQDPPLTPRFDASGPSVTAPPVGQGAITAAVSFTAITESGSTGQVRFQLSNDGFIWRYWDGVAWNAAGPTDHNDAGIVDQNINAFPVPSGWIWVRAFLLSDGTQPVGLERIEIENRDGVDLPTTLDSPILDPTSKTLWLRWELGRQATCTFRFSENDEGALSFVGIEVDTEPADGTNVQFTTSVGDLILDDAMPDDGDAYPAELLVSQLGNPDVKQIQLSDDGGLRPLAFDCGGREFYSSPTEVRYFIEWNDRIDCRARLAAGPNTDLEKVDGPIADYAVDATGSKIAWSQGGANIGDLGFLMLREDGITRELFSGVDFNPQSLSFSADGRYLAFHVDADLAGANPDGMDEVFRVDLSDESVAQITDTPSSYCNYFRVSVNDAGDVSFTTNCSSFNGHDLGPSPGVALGLWHDDAVSVTHAQGCYTYNAKLPRASTLPLVLFTSTCDFTGDNPHPDDGQLFLWAHEDDQVPYRQITRSAVQGSLNILDSSISDDGLFVAYTTNQDPATASSVIYPRLVVYDVVAGEYRVVDSLPAEHYFNFAELSVDNGLLVAIISAAGADSLISWDLSLEDPPERWRIDVTGGLDFPRVTRDVTTGRLRVFFSSNSDYEGLNPSGQDATWSLLFQP